MEHPVKDPVCGMDVGPGAAKGGSAEHSGQTYHFCSPRCREKFTADPARYVKGPGAAVEQETSAAATRVEYVCPMHPQIVRDAPGACPICGMALEPRTASLDEDNPEL